MLQLLLLIIGIGLILYSAYKWSTLKYNYFDSRGIKYLKPVPLLGNSGWIFTKANLPDIIQRYYNQFANERVFGSFDFRDPFYYIRDPALIKQLTVKDFDHFEDRRTFVNPEDDKVFGSMLVSMKGERWREMRSSLSPAFTSSKMRLMFELVSHCGNKMVKYFCEDFEKNGKQAYDMKDIFSKYTNDVIATCAFGVECDSLKQPNNEFFQVGKQLMQFQKPLQIVKFLLMRFAPKLAKMLNLKFLDEGTRKLFHSIIIDTMETRDKNGIVRQDMINLLMQLKSGKLKKSTEKENDGFAAVDEVESSSSNQTKTVWSDDELIAQCFLFFLAGFDTSSTLMAFTAYELAVNTDIQTKLQKEIDDMQETLQGKLLTYESLQKMKYLDMVIAEGLRKWPPAVVVDRLCVKDYHYKDETDGLELNIEKGQFIFLPIYAIQRDPQYFADPDKFNPERFSDENKHEINMDAYLPFGVGPRNCIGSRFALMEAKAVIYYLLSRFTLGVCSKTQVPLQLKKTPVGLIPDKEIMLDLIPRNKFQYTNDII